MTVSNDEFNMVLKEVIMPVCLSHDDYDIYRTIAMLSNTHNKIVEDNYRPIKERIEASSFYQCSRGVEARYVSWNKDFNRCAVATVVDSRLDKKSLGFILLGHDNKQVICLGRVSSEIFCFPVFEDNSRLVFKKEGQVYFYGYGDIEADKLVEYYCDNFDEMMFWKNMPITEQGLLEYSIRCIGCGVVQKCYRCFLKCKEMEGSMLYFLNNPALLKEFLQSTHVEKKSDSPITYYHLDGATIPDNYQDSKKHFSA